MISLQLSKIVGTSTEKGWSQVHTFTPTEPEKISQRGQLLAVISLEELKEERETVAAGREIIARLHEEYYGHLASPPLEQLEKAVKKVVTEVGSEAVVEMAAAAVVGRVLYLVIAGQGRLILQRKGEVATILSSEGAASGYLEGEDIFLLGTGRIFNLITKETLRTALTADSPEEATETIIPLIHAQEESGALAGVVAKVIGRVTKWQSDKVAKKMDEAEERKGKQTLREKVAALAKRLLSPSNISAFLFRLKRKIKKEKIYLGQRSERQKRSQRMLATVALILLLILGVSVVLGVWQRKHLSQKEQIAVLLGEARQKKEEGEALLELNPLQAKELLLAAQDLLTEIELRGESNQAVMEFKQELETLLPRVLREHQVEPKVYFDLELIKESARGDDLAVSAGQLVILDRGKLAVYSLGMKERQSAILAGGQEIEGARQVAAFLPQVFVLAEKGVVRADKSQSLVIEAEGNWGEVIDFRAFGGNLYLLDKGGIWKYPASAEASAGKAGFGERRSWLKEGADFSQAVSMAIDGAIWILESDGTISKYVQGRQEAFGVAGLNKPLINSIAIYTDDEQEKLYILDQARLDSRSPRVRLVFDGSRRVEAGQARQGDSRVVVLAKSGEYEAEYSWEGIGEVDGLVASEEEKKIFLVGGSKVYEIQLR